MGPDGPGMIVPVVKYGEHRADAPAGAGLGVKIRRSCITRKIWRHIISTLPHTDGFETPFKADAVVHIGTHGTLEWLDGKDIGLSEEDAPDALISDLPNVYIYNVDVVGEGLVARRRGMAELVDHMVPPFKKGGLYPELAGPRRVHQRLRSERKQRIRNWRMSFLEKIRNQVVKLGIDKDLSLDLSKPNSVDDALIHRIEGQLIHLKSQNIPYGLHAFGRTPEKELRESTIDAIVSTDRSLLPNQARIFSEDMDKRISDSGPAELDNLMRALRGGFLPVGSGGEGRFAIPIPIPQAENFYGIDPDKVPKESVVGTGREARGSNAGRLYEKTRTVYLRKFPSSSGVTKRCVTKECLNLRFFYLLGTKPVWNDRDKVVDVEVIPSASLGRPRVDIVIASAAEGMFNNVTLLMDKAVQKVKALEENENFVRRHYLETKRS